MWCLNNVEQVNLSIMKKINGLIILLLLIAFSCGDKKEEKESTSVKLEELHVEQEIKVLEAVTEEIKKTEASIEESIKKLDEMFNEL